MDAKKRPQRPATFRSGSYAIGDVSSEDDAEVMISRPAARSVRKQVKIDWSKLELSSLQKYRKYFKLAEAPPTTSKEDLIPAVARHFASQNLDEDETIIQFALSLNKRGAGGSRGAAGGVKKPAYGKPGPAAGQNRVVKPYGR